MANLSDFISRGVSTTKKSVNVSPANQASGQTLTPTLTGSEYYPLYSVPQEKRIFQIIASGGDFLTPLYEDEELRGTGNPKLSHTVSTSLSTDSTYEWRYRDLTEDGEYSVWSVPTEFTTANVYIATPSVTNPLNGQTDVGEQPVISGNAFDVINGSDTHTGTSVRIKNNSGTIIWSIDNGSTLNDIVVPAGVLDEGELNYTVEIKYHGATYGESAWSNPNSFTTAAAFAPTEPGVAFGGGYSAGIMDYSGMRYWVICSDGGGDSYRTGAGTKQWKTAQTTTTDSLSDGLSNFNAMISAGLSNHPAAKWIDDTMNVTNYNGYDDWYMPAKNELEVCYRAFKPTTQDNSTSYGSNPDSDPVGNNYTTTNPSQTDVISFRDNNDNAFYDGYYWSSSENSATSAWRQNFSYGNQFNRTKTDYNYVRAVRRLPL